MWMPGVERAHTVGRYRNRACHGVKGRPLFVVWHYTAAPWQPSWNRLTQVIGATWMVAKDGQIVQLCDTNDAPWTQGVRPANRLHHPLNDLARATEAVSTWANENLWAVSVEIENSGSEPYTDAQAAACERIAAWCDEALGIPRVRPLHVGHEELDRQKSDPGLDFPWETILMPAGGEGRSSPESDLTTLLVDRDRNYADKMAARAHLAEVIQAVNQVRDVVTTAEQWFHDPSGVDEGAT